MPKLQRSTRTRATPSTRSTSGRRAAFRRHRDERRSRGERGAALVEAAIVFVPLCIILFGIIEYGFIFKDSLTLSSATRAGARTASAEPRETSFFDDTVSAVARAASAAKFKTGDRLFIYSANSSGLPASGSDTSCTTSCIGYVWNGSGFTQSGGSGWPISTQNACLGDPAMSSVGVILELHHDAITGFFKNMVLRERTVMRLEPLEQNCKG